MGIRKPVGVVGAIAPWNAALILSARSIAAPLALGNTVVLKPSELVAVRRRAALGRDLRRGRPAAGRPEHRHARARRGGADRRRAGREPGVRRINFTGSTATGRRLAEAAGRQLKRVVLELGGYNPLIVLDDADLDYAVNASAFGAFLHQGQICMSTRRIFVERGDRRRVHRAARREDEGAEGRRPERARHDHRPAHQRGRAARWSARASTTRSPKGAKVLAGGEAVGPCYRATLITDVPGGLRLRQARDVRAGRRGRGRRLRRGGVAAGQRDRVRAVAPASSPATPTAASRSRSRSSRASSTSTTSRSATSRRCRSAASRTPASAASAAGGGRRVHRAALDHRPGRRRPPVPVLTPPPRAGFHARAGA